MDASDRTAVLARARHGDGEAFRALVEEHGRRAFQLAFRITGNEQDAEDVVQESFLRAYRQLNRFEARANFGTWLHRIVANCAVDAIRSRRSRLGSAHWEPLDETATVSADQPDPERMAESAEIGSRVKTALAGLSPLERAAFVLRHHEGRSIHEISTTLGLGTSAAKHSIFRAVRKLREVLRPTHGARPRQEDIWTSGTTAAKRT